MASSDEYEIVADRPIPKPHQRDDDWYEDESRRSKGERRRRRRSRSRSRMKSLDDLDMGQVNSGTRKPTRDTRFRNLRSSDYIEPSPVLPHIRAPSPPPVDRRRSARHSPASRPRDEEVEVRHTRPYHANDRDGRPVTVSRPTTSESKSQNGSRWNPPFGGRPPVMDSETIEMQERIQSPRTTEDYDWYDSHGQRVRVREI